MSAMVGTGSSLSAETAYVLRTLPKGVLAGLGDGARGDRRGFLRALAIGAGLVATALGYVQGTINHVMSRS